MRSWATAAVVLAVGASAAVAQASEPACAPESPSHREAVARLAGLDRAVRAGATEGEGAEALAALLAGDCLRGASQAIALGGARRDVLRAWWMGGGRSWLRAELWWDGGTRNVMLPPDVGAPFVPPVGPLGTALACSEPLGCELGDADRFLDEVVAEVAANFEGLTGDAERPEVHATSCGETVHAASSPDEFAAWWACVQKFRPRRPALPLGTFALPQSGVVRIVSAATSAVGSPKRCEHLQLVDLASGAALAASRCDGEPARGRAGFVERRRARELTLLAAVSGQIALRRPAAIVTLPKEITRTPTSSPHAEVTTPMLPVVRDGRAVKVKVTWSPAAGGRDQQRSVFETAADGAHFDPVAFDLERRVAAFSMLLRPGCPPLQAPPLDRGSGLLERALTTARRGACGAPAGPAPR